MRETELELIAALAEGRLQDETEARALIESDPELRAEYEAQKLAFDFLSDLGRATMSEIEKAALHRDLWTELRSSAAATPARHPWYMRWAPVAAGMFVMVGLVAVLNQGGSSDSAPVAAESSFVTTTLSDSTEASDGAGGADAADEAAPPGAEEGENITQAGTANLARALTPSGEQFYAETADKVRESAESEISLHSQEGDASSDRLQECVDQSGLDGYTVLGAQPSPVTGDEGEPVPQEATPFIAAIPEGSDLSSAPIAFVDMFACDLIYLDD